jgi:ABC-type transport system substrate-binding protein
MHRKFWFLAAAAVAVFALTGTAAAMGGHQTLFQKDWANVKWTPQARQAANQLNFGMEQKCPGFNSIDGAENAFWCVVAAEAQVLRGNYVLDNQAHYRLDLASSVVNTAKTLTIHIKDGANWAVEGGGTSPVVAADYALTYNVITDPRNPVASTTGYSLISGYTMPNGPDGKVIVFHWSKPFADYKDLFGGILPNFALPTANQLGANQGQAFDEMWRHCICVQTIDQNGDIVDHLNQQVSDGPFFLDSADINTGTVNTPNNRWYGPNPHLQQVNFIRVAPGNSEAQALSGGSLDAAFPAPAAAYVGLRSNNNFNYTAAKGYVQEHLDFNEANPLLAHPWMRQAIALGINRPALIKAVYYDTNIIPSGTMSQLNSPEFVLGKYAVAPYDYYKVWNFSASRALSILSAHCTGGPTSPNPNNTKVWQCPDGPASFDFETTLLPTRGASGAVYQSQLMQIGIKLTVNQSGNLFSTILPGAQPQAGEGGCTAGNPCGHQTYDIAEYAWVGSPDPSGFDAINECFDNQGRGGSNYKNYCNPAIDTAQAAGDSDVTSTRMNHYLKVAKIISTNAYIYPLYARPNILIYNKSVGGGISLANNPTSNGPTWNMETWTN